MLGGALLALESQLSVQIGSHHPWCLPSKPTLLMLVAQGFVKVG